MSSSESAVLAAGNLWENPMGTDGFEFVEYTAPDAAALGASLRAAWAFAAVARHRSKDVTALSPGRRELHRQCGAAQLRPGLCPAARPFGLRHRLSRARCGEGLSARALPRREAGAREGGADGAQHPCDRGHRRQPPLSRRPLWRPHDLRRRFRAGAGERAASPRRRARRHRSSDAQRPSGAHGVVGRLLREHSSIFARSATSTSRAS